MFEESVAKRLVKDPVRLGHWVDPVTGDVYNAPEWSGVDCVPDEAGEVAQVVEVAPSVEEVFDTSDQIADLAAAIAAIEAEEDDVDPKTGVPARKRGRPRKNQAE